MVCPDCVMFEEVHWNHKILRIKEILESKLEEINKEFIELEDTLHSTGIYLEKLGEYTTLLTSERDKWVKYLCSLFNGMK